MCLRHQTGHGRNSDGLRNRILPLFVDPQYVSSSWYKDTLAGIEKESSRQKLKVNVYYEPPGADIAGEIADVVALASGSRDYLGFMINRMTALSKKVILAGVDSGGFGEYVSSATVSRQFETIRLISYMKSCGRSRIAFFGLHRSSSNDMMRYAYVTNSAERSDYSIDKEHVYFIEVGDSFQQSFDRFYPHIANYDAVICPNDIVTVCFMQLAAKKGIRIPDDLFVGSFGNFHISRFCKPGLTTISIDYYELGVQTVNSWTFLMNNPHIAAIKITTPSKLIVRESTALMEEKEPVRPPMVHVSQHPLSDQFYADPMIAQAFRIEDFISARDELDMRIIDGILHHEVFEQLAEKLYISVSALRYRVSKMYQEAGVSSKSEFIRFLKQVHLGTVTS